MCVHNARREVFAIPMLWTVWSIVGTIRIVQAWDCAHGVWVHSHVFCCVSGSIFSAGICADWRQRRVQAFWWEVLGTILLSLLSAQAAAVCTIETKSRDESCAAVDFGPGQSYIMITGIILVNIRFGMVWVIPLLAVVAHVVREALNANMDGADFAAEVISMACAAIMALTCLRSRESSQVRRVTNVMVTAAPATQSQIRPAPQNSFKGLAGSSLGETEFDAVMTMPGAVAHSKSVDEFVKADTAVPRFNAARPEGSRSIPSSSGSPFHPPPETQSSQARRSGQARAADPSWSCQAGTERAQATKNEREIGAVEHGRMGDGAEVERCARMELSAAGERQSSSIHSTPDVGGVVQHGSHDAAECHPRAAQADLEVPVETAPAWCSTDQIDGADLQRDSHGSQISGATSLWSWGHFAEMALCGPFAGEWVLIGTANHPPSRTLSPWLRSLSISGNTVRDAHGKAFTLTFQDGHVYLAEGRLLRDGPYLVRVSRSQAECIYARADSVAQPRG
mmetsp:Transcript_26966/g.77376  ORF Transcript_26966/g.77376 Transcript_26966/m.77376 type:complete len:509 (+) Transcript_26966:105-1631(+)